MLRGLRGRCPNCGEGRMFRAFLKVADHCPACGEALHHQRADDAPAYFVILIVGHIVVPLVLAVETAFAPSYWIHVALWLPLTLGLSLCLLQPIKGALVGLAMGAAHARLQSGGSRRRRARTQPHHRTAPMTDINSDRIARLNDFVRRMNAVERDLSHKVIRPKDAATLILVDRSGRVPKVLLGKRHRAPQVHAGQVRVSRRRRRPDRQGDAGRDARSIRRPRCG